MYDRCEVRWEMKDRDKKRKIKGEVGHVREWDVMEFRI